MPEKIVRWNVRWPEPLLKRMKRTAIELGIRGNALVIKAVTAFVAAHEAKKRRLDPAKALKDAGVDFEYLWVVYKGWLPPGKTSGKTESVKHLAAFVERHKATNGELVKAFLLYLEGVETKYRREMQYAISNNLEDALERVRAPAPARVATTERS